MTLRLRVQGWDDISVLAELAFNPIWAGGLLFRLMRYLLG